MRWSTTLHDRASGSVTIVGGFLWAAGGITALNAETLGIAMTGPHLLLSLAGLCSLVGLASLAFHHADLSGPAGEIGAVLAGAGVVLIIASKNLPASTSESTGWALFDVGGLLLVCGSLVYGVAVVRTSKAWLFGGPLLAIAVLVVLQLVFMMASFAGTAYLGTVALPTLIGFAWAVLGYALWSHPTETIEERSGTDRHPAVKARR